jgi:hypothetical protein
MMAARPAARGRREHGEQRRDLTVTVRFSEAEKAAVDAAAGRAGLATSAYLGQAGLDAAENRAAPVSQSHRDLLAELIRASGLVRRAGANLNQAVARLNATGAAGPDLVPAAAYVTRVARHVDEAALRISRGLS